MNTINVKRKLEMGLRVDLKKKKKKKNSMVLRQIVDAAKKVMLPVGDTRVLVKSALIGALTGVKRAGGKSRIRSPRVFPVPLKIGGFLPLLSTTCLLYHMTIFAGLSVFVGTLAGGAADIIKAVNNATSAKRQLKESLRHNKTMEAVALSKGLYLKPYKEDWVFAYSRIQKTN